MLPQWVWIIFGIIVSIGWVVALVLSVLMFWKWWKTTGIKNDITPKDIFGKLLDIETSINNLANEIRQDRDERNKS